jgi:hypothetical protein
VAIASLSAHTVSGAGRGHAEPDVTVLAILLPFGVDEAYF